MSEEYVEEAESEGLDLEAIAKQYEERGFFKRLGDMFKGLGMAHNTREYRLARIELQRLAAPLVAIVVPVLGVITLVVITAVTGQKKEVIVLDIQRAEEVEEDVIEEEEPPDDIEIPPMEDVEILVETPSPSPITNLTPTPTPPNTQVSVKPATQDSVAIVQSPIKMASMTGSRTPGSIGEKTRGGDGYGDAVTEACVMKTLWWLKAHQNTDGSWGGGEFAVANTAFAVLTYLAHGEYPGSPSPYKHDFGPVVQRAVDYLIGHLTERDAGPGKKVPCFQPTDGNEYSFCIATYALCEAYGMTKNPNCKEAALKCLDRIVKGQSPTGGWDYQINPKSTRDDLSFAGWAMQALKAGKMSGLKPDGLEKAIAKAIVCLKKRSYSKTGGFTYTPMGGNVGGSTGLAGVGCLAMQLLGHGTEAEAVNALDVMRDWKPSFDRKTLTKNADGIASPQYYCYYATQCKYQAGMRAGATKPDEKTWMAWNVAMKKLYPTAIIDLPEKVKDYKGKEHKQGYFENKDDASTRPYMDTCLAALQLMVYYRYLPTTSVKAGEVEDDKKKDKEDSSSTAVDKGEDVGVQVEI